MHAEGASYSAYRISSVEPKSIALLSRKSKQNYGHYARLSRPIHRASPHFPRREFVRGYYDAVRELGQEILTADDVVIFLMRRKGLDVSNAVLRKSMRRQVVAMRRRIQRRGGSA
jgi:hypothetical protein